MINGWRDQRAFGRFKVTHVVRSVGDRLRVRRPAETNLIDRGFQQRVEPGGYEKIEVMDLRELPKRLWRGEIGLLHDAADPRVECLTAAVPAQIERDDLVQGRRQRQRTGWQPEARRKPSGDIVFERDRLAIGDDGRRLRPNDGNYPLLLDMRE